MTRERWRKHKEAIKWFYGQEEGTKIWCKCEGTDWGLIDEPSWYLDCIYVINDEYVELRMAIADGKQIEVKLIGSEDDWALCKKTDPNGKFSRPVDNYRIKPEVKFPIYKKNDCAIVKFLSKDRFQVIFIFNPSKAINNYNNENGLTDIIGTVYCGSIESKEWQNVLYDEDKKLWDGQPVWAWDKEDIAHHIIGFYDVKNKKLFNYNGKRINESYKMYDYYEPYLHLNDEWVIEAYNKLDFES